MISIDAQRFYTLLQANLRLTFRRTLLDRLHICGQTQPAEAVVEDLVGLERCRGVVCDLDAGSQAVEDTVPDQHRVTLQGI